MSRRAKYFFLLGAAALITVFCVNFLFNPCGLGPEPPKVLPDFFSLPVNDLSCLELLVDGREAADRIREELAAAQSSVFIQIYIWKDDHIGRRLANILNLLRRKG